MPRLSFYGLSVVFAGAWVYLIKININHSLLLARASLIITAAIALIWISYSYGEKRPRSPLRAWLREKKKG